MGALALFACSHAAKSTPRPILAAWAEHTDRQTASKKIKNKSMLFFENSMGYWKERRHLFHAGTLAMKKYGGFTEFQENRTGT